LSRFDSKELLTAWQTKGKFPAIHDAIWSMILQTKSRQFLDLGCCHGLLCQRIYQEWPEAVVIGLDSNLSSIEAGRRAGVQPTMVQIQVSKKTIPDIRSLVEANGIKVLVARRCFPEFFGDDLPAGREFGAEMRSAGIETIVLQGRVPVKNPVNVLCTVEHEVSLLSESFKSVMVNGQVAFLEAR